MTSTLLITDEAMLEHSGGEGHPERPDRLRAIRMELERAAVPGVEWAKAQPAAAASIARVHTPEHVARIESLRGRSVRLDPDTATSPGSTNAALLAAGAAIDAATAVTQGRSKRAFALVRPPGHHAETGAAMGFCLFNNIAIAAEHARHVLGMERVLIVDWDVHHGNGTQHSFYARPDVLVFNTHRFPFYPGTGALNETGSGAGEGYTVNVPLPGHLEDPDYAAIFGDLLEPVAESFKPDLVLVSAGFDAHRDDPLADMSVTEEGFAHLCGVVCDIADKHAQGRLALVLEGGYDLRALAKSVRGCVEVLAGSTPPEINALPSRPGERAISEALTVHGRKWAL